MNREDLYEKILETYNNPRERAKLSVKNCFVFLEANGWDVNISESSRQGAGRKKGRNYVVSPKTYRFTKYEAKKGDVKISRHYDYITTKDVVFQIVMAYKIKK